MEQDSNFRPTAFMPPERRATLHAQPSDPSIKCMTYIREEPRFELENTDEGDNPISEAKPIFPTSIGGYQEANYEQGQKDYCLCFAGHRRHSFHFSWWSGWNAFYGFYDESTVVGVADAMATNGMLAAGYNIISIDVAWMLGRDTNGVPIINTNRFPHGLRWLGDYVHAKGFKFGAYGMLGAWTPTNTCDPTGPGRGGSVGYEDIDAALWASWGADYLKYDVGCVSPNSVIVDHAAMRDALSRTGRPIIYMLSGGYFAPYKAEVSNLWRTFLDIWGSWSSVLTNADVNSWGARYAKPGAWNDPDMLEVGNGYLTAAEERSHFALWCIMAAPLIAGNDVRNMSSNTLQILTASELIAVDQDVAGVQGVRVSRQGGAEVWCKPLGFDGTEKAVVLLNRGTMTTNITVFWTNILLQPVTALVRDLWARTNLGSFTNSFTAAVGPHGCVALKISGATCGKPIFLSDLPFANLPSLPETNGIGPLQRDLSASLQTLWHDQTYYPKGIGTVAPSRCSFLLTNHPGMTLRFLADIGIDDVCGGSGSVVFQVWADGANLFESSTIRGGSPNQSIHLDITGRNVLTLVVTDNGDGNVCDHANWADARILQAAVPVVISVSRRPSGVRLEWLSVSGVRYQVESSETLGGTWGSESGLLEGTGEILRFDLSTESVPLKFLRVRTEGSF
jgi:alpha-galactosidase